MTRPARPYTPTGSTAADNTYTFAGANVTDINASLNAALKPQLVKIMTNTGWFVEYRPGDVDLSTVEHHELMIHDGSSFAPVITMYKST